MKHILKVMWHITVWRFEHVIPVNLMFIPPKSTDLPIKLTLKPKNIDFKKRLIKCFPIYKDQPQKIARIKKAKPTSKIL